MRTPQKSKTDIVDDFIKVFRANGLYGTTLSQLVKSSGLQRASLYHYFPNGKTDMYEAVLLKVVNELKETVISKLEENHSYEQRLKNMLKAVDKFYNSGSNLCFITIFSIGESSPLVRQTLSSAVNLWITSIEKNLKKMKLKNSKHIAQSIVANIQGSLILAHAAGDLSIFKNCLKNINSSLVHKTFSK